ncbi:MULTISPECIES: DUF2256 domain-containing protein [unclassified Synechococcus]|uniref:DUF2256 domain-containing protein n=1 Tax=unclassified Synechococcus TaxID=2626047 RepID=UPI000B98DF90|nr:MULTISPECIES: DUF2256 domain-containing protein [unclassified Synechococcus]MCP9827276.1 DUF2256 domain-containing protein [Synechococcus sp. L2F]MCP9845764.1 DUF2256 domain-containing protein [Synechococcus sp. Lug-A]
MAAQQPANRPSRRGDRPTKICPVCGRPFQWRRRWSAVWEEVRYCSERCRRRRGGTVEPATR